MKLSQELWKHLGIKVTRCQKLEGGWLNDKWLVNEKWVVKCYSSQRYAPDRFADIRQALQIQSQLYERGVCCPCVLKDAHQEVLHTSEDGEIYMVMTYLAGMVYRHVNQEQMTSLGRECLKMHTEMARLPSPAKTDLLSKAQVEQAWLKRRPQTPLASLQRQILDHLDDSFFAQLPSGYAHEDLSNDNCLFEGNQLSAILDFDRCTYSYPLHDVGRVLLSLAYEDGKLNLPLIQAFLKGYSTLRLADVALSLRIVWLIEAGWWLNAAKGQSSDPKIQRFYEELLFLTEHFDHLEALLGI